jgi:nicotinamidase-related amidase
MEDCVVPNIRRLLDYSRRRAILVIYLTFGSAHRDLRDMTPRLRQMLTEFEARGGVKDIYWSANPSFKIRSELSPWPGELVVNKTTFGAFCSTALNGILREKRINTLIFTGVSTNCCVETTAREAAERGFECVLVDQATADYDARAHEEALRGFYFNFGRVVRCAEDLIAKLEEEAIL